MQKNDLKIFIFPIGLILGVIIGEIIKNVAIGVAIGAILGIIVTLVFRFFKMPKDKENKKNEDK